MSGTLDRQMPFPSGAWPWERPPARSRGWAGLRGVLSRVWSLSTLTTTVVVAGYAWLGYVAWEGAGALAGAAAGLVTSAGLHVAVGRAVSGPRGHRSASGRERSAVL